MIASGTRLGPYEITAAIGAGGMGEVLRARDTSLDRDVAIKVLPAALASDVERRARFKREAQVLASLNHPNIAHVYGFEGATLPDGSTVHFLAMELVEGEDLAERLKRGALPVDESIAIAKQIAEGLEEAHEHGIIHRDLKPANIKLTPDGKVKVLDFGLAKAYLGESASGSSADLSQSPTLAHTGTQAGIILGTAAYMSPEQARGKTVDKRADIWSFGVVLFEMLTGTRLFAGETVSDTLAAVLREEIPWARLAKETPRGLVQILRRCLTRDPHDRMRDIGEARLALLDGDSGAGQADASSPAGSPRSAWPIAVAVVAGALATVAAYTTLGNRVPATAPPIRTTIDIPESLVLDPNDRAIALSSDGAEIALTIWSPATNQQQLFLRSLDRLDLRPLAGTEGASYPFWSPDGRALGFFADSKLKRIDLQGGIVRTLCVAPAGRGAAWSPRGFIVFAPGAGGALSQVSADGGVPTAFTKLLREGEGHRLPHFLPGGRRVLFISEQRQSTGEKAIYVFDPDRSEAKKIMDSETEALFVEPGFLIFARDENLMAQAFDPERLILSGAARPIASGMQYNMARYFLGLDLTSCGRLVYEQTPKGSGLHLVWLNRDGTETAAQAEPLDLGLVSARVSPDGRRLAMNTLTAHADYRVSALDFDRGTRTPIGDPRAYAYGAAWSPDGSALAIGIVINGFAELAWIRAQAGERPRGLTSSAGFDRHVGDFTPDGSTILFGRYSEADKLGDLLLVDTEGKDPERTYLGGPGDENYPRLSPDGRFVAYLSDASGNLEVWVADFPDARGRWQISSRYHASRVARSGSLDFRDAAGFGWMSSDEIYWQDLSGQVEAAAIRTRGADLEVGSRRLLFGGRALTSREGLFDFSFARQKFLLARAAAPASAPKLVFVSDWRAALGEQKEP